MQEMLICRIPKKLHTEFKAFCALNNVSMTKKTEELISLYLLEVKKANNKLAS